jgi:hypothetical protein
MSKILCQTEVMANPNNPVFLVCNCGQTFRKYKDGSRQRYCSPECRKKYSRVGDRLRDDPELARRIASQPKPNHGLKGHKQTREHVLKRMHSGKRRASREELSLIPALDKLGYKHNHGDGRWFTWPDGTVHNPDFLDEKDHRVFEYHGDFWHQGEDEAYTKAQWAQLGYRCTILWGRDRRTFLESMGEDVEVADAFARGLDIPVVEWKVKVTKTHCSMGHELQFPNLRPPRKRHLRECLACFQTQQISRRRSDLNKRLVAAACYREIIVGLPNPYRRTKSEALLAHWSKL